MSNRKAQPEDDEAARIEAAKAGRAMPPTEEAEVRVLSLIGPSKGQEISIPYSAAQSGVASGFYARIEGVVYPPDFPGAPPVMATTGAIAPEVTPEAAAEEVSGTVAEATEHVAAAETIEALDAIEAAEKDGKGRKGVLEAIAKRRAELDPTFGTVAEVSERIATLDAAALDKADTAERQGRARKGVLAAIDARRAALKAEAEAKPETDEE